MLLALVCLALALSSRMLPTLPRPQLSPAPPVAPAMEALPIDEARVLLQNGRANGALRKLGAAQEGVLRRSVRRGGEYLDQVLWSMLKEDWGDHWMSTSPRVH